MVTSVSGNKTNWPMEKVGDKTLFGELIIWYLFLGGAGSGVAVILTVLDIIGGLYKASIERTKLAWSKHLNRRFLLVGYSLGTLMLIVGALCLMVDLGRPERFFYVFTYPTLSILSLGSFFLGVMIVCSGLLSLAAFRVLAKAPLWLIRTIQAITLVFGFATMVYTGVLFMEMDFGLVWGNPGLPVLFTFSSLSAGVAVVVVSIFVCYQGLKRKDMLSGIILIDFVVIVLEMVCVGIFLFSMDASAGEVGFPSDVISLLTSEYVGAFLVGFVVFGVLVPFVLEVVYARMENSAIMAMMIPFVLLGALYLRYWVVNAYAL